nr:S8 family serine peptidase [Micromonospora sp. DSM 115978]
MRRTVAAGAAVAALLAGILAPGGPPASAGQADRNCAEPGQPISRVPWPQQMLGPERAWPFTQGGGVTVAVLDSGVDAGHPQLSGRVAAGFDAVDGGTADDDCLGTGTQVAGVIAAGQIGSVGFAGVAPQVRILPIRVLDDRGGNRGIAEPGVLADGLDAAVDRDADVIAISAVTYTEDVALRLAVSRALDEGILLLAAVGDRGDEDGEVVPYPAAYPGVLGIGAIDQNGELWRGSQRGPFVDLVAPGAAVPTAQRGDGMTLADGTGVACGFAAGSAALVRARQGDPSPDEVVRQLFATAVQTAGGSAFGRGIVNPHAAVTDRRAVDEPAALPALVRPAEQDSSAWRRSRDLAVAGSVSALVVVVAVLLAAVALPRGRRRLWRSGTAAPPAGRPESEEPAPPMPLFPSGT